MRIVLSLIGIVGSFFLIKYREKAGDMIGEAEWMNKIGGVYNLMVIVAVFIFLWSIAELTGTTDVVFAPLLWLFPHAAIESSSPGFIID